MSKREMLWHKYFMGVAEQVSTMATCGRLKVGCVLVKDKRIIATGFNGSISGHDHCDDVGHLYNDEGRCIRTVHAEQNAIIQCAKYGIPTDGAIAYVTHEPCEHCTKLLAQAGIKTVYFKERYNNKYNHHFYKGMEWIYLPDEVINKVIEKYGDEDDKTIYDSRGIPAVYFQARGS